MLLSRHGGRFVAHVGLTALHVAVLAERFVAQFRYGDGICGAVSARAAVCSAILTRSHGFWHSYSMYLILD